VEKLHVLCWMVASSVQTDIQSIRYDRGADGSLASAPSAGCPIPERGRLSSGSSVVACGDHGPHTGDWVGHDRGRGPGDVWVAEVEFRSFHPRIQRRTWPAGPHGRGGVHHRGNLFPRWIAGGVTAFPALDRRPDYYEHRLFGRSFLETAGH